MRQQMNMLSQLTGLTTAQVSDSIQRIRQRRLDQSLYPRLRKMLERLRPLRVADSKAISYTRRFAIPLESALRLAALLEQSEEPDGYVYTVVINPVPTNRHALSVTWRHPFSRRQHAMHYDEGWQHVHG